MRQNYLFSTYFMSETSRDLFIISPTFRFTSPLKWSSHNQFYALFLLSSIHFLYLFVVAFDTAKQQHVFMLFYSAEPGKKIENLWNLILIFSNRIFSTQETITPFQRVNSLELILFNLILLFRSSAQFNKNLHKKFQIAWCAPNNLKLVQLNTQYRHSQHNSTDE